MSCLSSGPGGDASALVLNALISRTRNLESTCGATTNNGTLTVKGVITAEDGIIVNGALVSDSLVNNGDLVSTTLTATNGINGVLLTAAQPNITSVGTLSNITTPNWTVDSSGNTLQSGLATADRLFILNQTYLQGAVDISPPIGLSAITVLMKAGVTIDGTLTQTGNTTRTGTLTQTGNTNNTGTLNQSGNVVINGTLTQTGNTTRTGTLTQAGNTNNTGTLTQTGNISCSGVITLYNQLAVNSTTVYTSITSDKIGYQYKVLPSTAFIVNNTILQLASVSLPPGVYISDTIFRFGNTPSNFCNVTGTSFFLANAFSSNPSVIYARVVDASTKAITNLVSVTLTLNTQFTLTATTTIYLVVQVSHSGTTTNVQGNGSLDLSQFCVTRIA